jgi:hypothetical protein
MSIHIPQAFLHNHGNGHGSGSGHSSNYLVNKFSSGRGTGPTNGMNFKFDQDTSSYFYNELSKILNNEAASDDQKNANTNENVIVSDTMDTTDNICLITKEKLHPNHITLSCKHKFNYVPLYNEVINQKNKQNNIYEVTKLSSNQIKCPYCRIITNKLLPHIPYPCVKGIKNVNSYVTASYNSNPDYFLYAPKCTYHNTKHPDPCKKYGVYYETENVLLCPQHYKLYTIKQKTGSKKVEKGVETEVAKGCVDIGCSVILKSGKNIGKKCGVRCVGVDGGSVGENNTEVKYCKKHYKMLYSNT